MSRHVLALAVALLAVSPDLAYAQDSNASPATRTALDMVASIERRLLAVAEEMPSEKYDFVPPGETFRGVRTFGRQLKHAAAAQHLVAATLLGEPVTGDMADERGPDAVRTKVEVQQYLRGSFAALRRAAAAIDDRTAFERVKTPFSSEPQTRLGLLAQIVGHSWNHYGQVVPYLRLNGLVPPPTP